MSQVYNISMGILLTSRTYVLIFIVYCIYGQNIVNLECHMHKKILNVECMWHIIFFLFEIVRSS